MPSGRLLVVAASLAAAKEHPLVEEHRLRREAAALNLSRSCPIPMQHGSCQVNAKHPCAPLGKGCGRPCGVFHVHMRGTGGKFYGENLMNHLFRRDVSFWMLEGSSLAVPKAKERLAAMLPGSLRTVILRHPIERILSRYWMEGRWDLFKQASAESATPLERWIRFTKTRNSGTRLWQMPQEYYTKTLVGWQGKPLCDACLNGLGHAQLERAQDLVSAPGWFVLVSEWLSAPPQVEALARALCFATDGRGRGVELDGELVPSFKAKRAAGGHSRERPRGWAPNASTLEALWRDNAHDLHLYEWAARGVHSRLVAEGTMGAGPLPLLPPVSSARAFHAWLVQCRDEPASAGCARGRIFHALGD